MPHQASLSNYLPIAGGRIIGFILFPSVLVLCETQSASSRIWTRVAVSIYYDNNHYTTGTSYDYVSAYICLCIKSWEGDAVEYTDCIPAEWWDPLLLHSHNTIARIHTQIYAETSYNMWLNTRHDSVQLRTIITIIHSCWVLQEIGLLPDMIMFNQSRFLLLTYLWLYFIFFSLIPCTNFQTPTSFPASPLFFFPPSFFFLPSFFLFVPFLFFSSCSLLLSLSFCFSSSPSFSLFLSFFHPNFFFSSPLFYFLPCSPSNYSFSISFASDSTLALKYN